MKKNFMVLYTKLHYIKNNYYEITAHRISYSTKIS